jgi:hypothetical protein
VTKWADYCISAVRFNDKRTHIDKVKRHLDNDTTIGPGSESSRENVIADLKRGTTYLTIFQDQSNNWSKGQKVYIVKISGTEFIKTAAATNSRQDRLPAFPKRP